MKVLSPEEEQAHYNAVIKGGATWGGAGLLGGTLAASLLNQRSHVFRSLTLPLKAFAVSSVTTFALIVGADRGSREFEEASHREQNLGMEDETLEKRIGIQARQQRDDSGMSSSAKVISYLNDNKYSIVATAWAASLVGSFAYISYSPLTTAQKVVQARMYAQGSTVLMLLASAGLAASASKAHPEEAEEEERMRENTMYRFKKNSPHEKQERERQRRHREQLEREEQ